MLRNADSSHMYMMYLTFDFHAIGGSLFYNRGDPWPMLTSMIYLLNHCFSNGIYWAVGGWVGEQMDINHNSA